MLVEVGPHVLVHGMGVEKIQRQEATLVLEGGNAPDLWIGAAGLVELAALAVDEHGIRALGRNRLHH